MSKTKDLDQLEEIVSVIAGADFDARIALHELLDAVGKLAKWIKRQESNSAKNAQKWFAEQLVDADWSSKSLATLLDKLRKSSNNNNDITYTISYLFMRLVEEGKVNMSLEVEGKPSLKDDETPEVELKGSVVAAEEDQITYQFKPAKRWARSNKFVVSGAWLRVLIEADQED